MYTFYSPTQTGEWETGNKSTALNENENATPVPVKTLQVKRSA